MQTRHLAAFTTLLAVFAHPAMALAEGQVYVCNETAAQYRVVEDANAYGDPITVPGCSVMVAVPLSAASGAFTLQRWTPSNPGDPWAIWQPTTDLPAGWSFYTPAGWQTPAQLQGAAPAASPAVAPPVTPPPVVVPAGNGGASAPTALSTLNATSATLTLRWSAATNAAGYRIYRNGQAVGTTPGPRGTSFVDGSLSPNTGYAYTVTAIDAAGNESAPSAGTSGATTPSEAAGARIVYRFPTSQARWDEFFDTVDGSIAFPIYGPNTLEVSNFGQSNPATQGEISRAHGQGRNLRVIGHLNGVGSTAPIEVLKSEIDSWYANYSGIDGIYVGNAGYDPRSKSADAFIAYWAEIAAYIHQKGGIAFMHGGAPLGGGDFATETANGRRLLDYYEVLTVYESYWDWHPYPNLYGWMNSGGAYAFRYRYAAFINGIPGGQLGAITNYFISRNVGYLYVSDVDLNHAVSDGSQDPRDDPAYWRCENTLLQLQPAGC